MSEKFPAAYSSLTEFITAHPEIEIGESVISLPGEVRPDFYNLFNLARRAFVEDKYPDFLIRAGALQKHYQEAEEKTAALFSLEDSTAVSPVRRFLRDPMDSLARQLFDLLFDLLKGKQDPDSFESKGAAAIDSVASDLYRAGYERWVVLSLVSILAPDRTLRVDARRLNPGEKPKSMLHSPLDSVPVPEESATFLFDQPREAVFAVPDFIVHSGTLRRFVAFRSDFKTGVYHAQNRTPDREWYPVETGLLRILESGLALIYAAEEAQQIALVADVGKLCRPDLLLWCVQGSSLDQPEAAEKMSGVHKQLNPTAGTFIIADEPWPELLEKQEVDGLHCISAGFEPLLLHPVIDALAGKPGPT